MLKICNPNKAALDIGANLGVITLFLRRYSSHVYCFEPIPRLCNLLKEKYHNCNVTVESCALGNVEGEMYFNIPIVGNVKYESRGSLDLNPNHEYIFGEKVTTIEKILVSVKRLDDFQYKNLGFVKIDVEGFEYNVLKGAEETIKRNMPNIFIEIEQRYHSDNIFDIIKYIMDLGYFGYFLYDKSIRSIKDFDTNKYQDNSNDGSIAYINNFIFLPYQISNSKL
jgi:FkbM family methyltransferase